MQPLQPLIPCPMSVVLGSKTNFFNFTEEPKLKNYNIRIVFHTLRTSMKNEQLLSNSYKNYTYFEAYQKQIYLDNSNVVL